MILEEARAAAAFGIRYAPPEIDLAVMRAKKDAVIEQLARGLDTLCKARGITRLRGRGVFRNAHTLVITGETGETEITFRDAIIATGSRPSVLPDCPDDPRFWDSSDALALRVCPDAFS